VPVAKHEKDGPSVHDVRRRDEVPADRRSAMLAQCDEILGASWHMTGRVGGAPVGLRRELRDSYSCSAKTSPWGSRSTNDSRSTPAESCIAPAPISSCAPGPGLYSRLRDLIISTELYETELGEARRPTMRGGREIPIVWATNARVCRSVVPSLLDGAVDSRLVELARRVATSCTRTTRSKSRP